MEKLIRRKNSEIPLNYKSFHADVATLSFSFLVFMQISGRRIVFSRNFDNQTLHPRLLTPRHNQVRSGQVLNFKKKRFVVMIFLFVVNQDKKLKTCF